MSSTNFRYIDTRPKSSPQPVGFYRYKAGQVYKSSVPPPNNGSHVKLHSNLSAHFSRPDTCKETRAYGPAFRILYKQRQRQKIFSGQAPVNLYEKSGQLTTSKLSSYDPTRYPAGSTMYRDALFFPHVICNKPLYSKDEVQSIVNRLYQRKNYEGRCPHMANIDQNRKTYPAEMVDKLANQYTSTNRLCPKSPFRNLFRDRIAAHTICSTSKRITDDEFGNMVNRLNEYDTQKWPPNSTAVETQEAGSPEKVMYPPGHGHASPSTIDATVDRLYSGRWRSTVSKDEGHDNMRSPDIKSPVSSGWDGQHHNNQTNYDDHHSNHDSDDQDHN